MLGLNDSEVNFIKKLQVKFTFLTIKLRQKHENDKKKFSALCKQLIVALIIFVAAILITGYYKLYNKIFHNLIFHNLNKEDYIKLAGISILCFVWLVFTCKAIYHFVSSKRNNLSNTDIQKLGNNIDNFFNTKQIKDIFSVILSTSKNCMPEGISQDQQKIILFVQSVIKGLTSQSLSSIKLSSLQQYLLNFNDTVYTEFQSLEEKIVALERGGLNNAYETSYTTSNAEASYENRSESRSNDTEIQLREKYQERLSSGTIQDDTEGIGYCTNKTSDILNCRLPATSHQQYTNDHESYNQMQKNIEQIKEGLQALHNTLDKRLPEESQESQVFDKRIDENAADIKYLFEWSGILKESIAVLQNSTAKLFAENLLKIAEQDANEKSLLLREQQDKTRSSGNPATYQTSTSLQEVTASIEHTMTQYRGENL